MEPYSPSLPFPVSGAILAGGRSSRMGCDKAFLTIDGVSLVARQAALFRGLGIDDLLISGRVGVNYAVPDARVVTDRVPDAGPLAGLAAVLSAARHPWVLVVAVDLPHITSTYLQTLLAAGAGRVGVVPHGLHGYEPLVALYPRTLLVQIETALAKNQLGLQGLLHAAVQQRELERVEIKASECPLFVNWNNPEDIPSSPSRSS